MTAVRAGEPPCLSTTAADGPEVVNFIICFALGASVLSLLSLSLQLSVFPLVDGAAWQTNLHHTGLTPSFDISRHRLSFYH